MEIRKHMYEYVHIRETRTTRRRVGLKTQRHRDIQVRKPLVLQICKKSGKMEMDLYSFKKET